MATVYYFVKYSIETDQQLRSHRPATREAIDMINGVPIEATGVEVDAAQLDSEQFLKARHCATCGARLEILMTGFRVESQPASLRDEIFTCPAGHEKWTLEGANLRWRRDG